MNKKFTDLRRIMKEILLPWAFLASLKVLINGSLHYLRNPKLRVAPQPLRHGAPSTIKNMPSINFFLSRSSPTENCGKYRFQNAAAINSFKSSLRVQGGADCNGKSF